MSTLPKALSYPGFLLWRGLAELPAPYPDPATFFSALKSASRIQRELVARLWVGEGVPYCFRATPAVYEEMRHWLGKRLRVDPKEITLIGSSRIGFSMSPNEFGRPFSENSDLDISIISSALFAETKDCFHAWEADLGRGTVHPRNERERRLWPENIEFGRRNIPKGFMDPGKIPTIKRYELAQRVVNTMWALSVRVANSECGHPQRRASVRVYRDQISFIQRLLFNLSAALDKRETGAT